MDNPFAVPSAGREYHDVRPGYPKEAVRAVLDAPARKVVDVADIGAGTGKFSRAIVQVAPELHVIAIEPSAQMRDSFPGPLTPRDGTGEHTGLDPKSVDLAVWAQSFHWIDPEAAGVETCRILRTGGAAAVVYNQLDVRIPWVHRLTRIMRSGDVHRPDHPPVLPGFEAEGLREFPWEQRLTTDQVMALARTRSSYLRSSEGTRSHMQANLEWYLHQHLGYTRGDEVVLPYSTQVWVLRVAS